MYRDGLDYQLDELVVCSAIDEAVLTDIEDSLLEKRLAGASGTAFLRLDKRDAVLQADDGIPLESLMEIAGAIKRYQVNHNRLLGTITMHAAIVNFRLEPLWHAEPISDAFVATTKAPTEGLSGKVPARSMTEAAAIITRHAMADPEFTRLAGVRVVRPPLHSLLHIPYGAFHRSPVPNEESPSEKLIINSTVMPTFMF